MPMNKAYFLDDVDIRQFDTSVFPISKSELERLDPQQRQLLEVAYECMENAGQASWRGKNIGCYVGVFGEDWLDLYAKETQHRKGYRVTGYGDFVLGNRISYEFDLHGPRSVPLLVHFMLDGTGVILTQNQYDGQNGLLLIPRMFRFGMRSNSKRRVRLRNGRRYELDLFADNDVGAQ
jgi:hypothetical protein